MVVRTSVEVEEGRAVVRRIATEGDAPGAARLREAASALGAAAGDGVVAIVRTGPVPGLGWELVVEHAGLPLDAHRVGSPSGLARLASAVAATLGELHERGLAHGCVEAEHVLVGATGRPLLTGFGAGGAQPADDVASLGRLIASVGAALPRPSSARERSRLALLVDLAGRASALDPHRRPTARRLAAELDRVAGGPNPRARGRARTLGMVGAALAGVALLVGLAGTRGSGGGAREEGAGSVRAGAEVPVAGPRAAPCVATADHPVQVGGGCPTAAAVVDGAVVVAGRRHVVGRPGDVIVVGDWGCEGAVRPAVLRPATGEVLVFAPLGGADGPEVVFAERFPGATDLVARLDDGGCAALVVRAPGGDRPVP